MSSTRLRVKELLRERRWTTKVLAEKTGMSESYLTHIKNGTRRWNEDSLRKLSEAFELEPTDLFAYKNSRTDNVEQVGVLSEDKDFSSSLRMKIVPVVGEIPTNPSPYNNQQIQADTGYADSFIPVFNSEDNDIFCLAVDNQEMAPRFSKGDMLVISPAIWTKSGDIVAVEYTVDEKLKREIKQISYMDDFIVLESVNHKTPPIALVRGKDTSRILGKVIWRYQRMKTEPTLPQ
jgi:SOS-response transcriptional repressor LexA